VEGRRDHIGSEDQFCTTNIDGCILVNAIFWGELCVGSTKWAHTSMELMFHVKPLMAERCGRLTRSNLMLESVSYDQY